MLDALFCSLLAFIFGVLTGCYLGEQAMIERHKIKDARPFWRSGK